MFGYVQVRKAELKVKDYELYHSFYCGLCHELKERHGIKGQITLTYDCTFLVMLLSSLYELEVEKKTCRCIVHPAKKHALSITDASRYCADMNVLLSLYHFKDKERVCLSVPWHSQSHERTGSSGKDGCSRRIG